MTAVKLVSGAACSAKVMPSANHPSRGGSPSDASAPYPVRARVSTPRKSFLIIASIRYTTAMTDQHDKTQNARIAPEAGANAMWGGRFAAGPDAIMERINASIDVDRRFYRQDITASRAHAAMLVAQGIISAEDGEAIDKGLEQILGEIDAGEFTFSAALEDIHMNVEARLRELIGPAAGRLHTARSRNDQVATDFRLWVRDALDQLDEGLSDLQAALLDLAEKEAATVMPGYTHLQAAQPVTFGHHLLAYVEMIGRDRGRFADCRQRLNESPLGAAALAGTSFPIDRFMTAKALGFDRFMTAKALGFDTLRRCHDRLPRRWDWAW